MVLQGILIFQRANRGSHSEGIFPYLYCGYGELIRVALIGDVPFQNRILRRYDGKTVALEGDYDLNEIFMAVSVIELESLVLSAPAEENTEGLDLILPAPAEENTEGLDLILPDRD
jgi:hypothetical protein